MMINLHKSFDVFHFIMINLFLVFLMLPHFTLSQMLKKRNYAKVLPILIQADHESADIMTINMAISMTNDGDQASCNYKTGFAFSHSCSNFFFKLMRKSLNFKGLNIEIMHLSLFCNHVLRIAEEVWGKVQVASCSLLGLGCCGNSFYSQWHFQPKKHSRRWKGGWKD